MPKIRLRAPFASRGAVSGLKACTFCLSCSEQAARIQLSYSREAMTAPMGTSINDSGIDGPHVAGQSSSASQTIMIALGDLAIASCRARATPSACLVRLPTGRLSSTNRLLGCRTGSSSTYQVVAASVVLRMRLQRIGIAWTSPFPSTMQTSRFTCPVLRRPLGRSPRGVGPRTS